MSLGLRIEHERGPLERFDRMLTAFDPDLANPVADPARAAYAARPIPELPASQFQVRGGSVYAGGSRRQQ